VIVKGQDATPTSPYALFWQQKPRWCQPWSILLTGVIGIGTIVWVDQHFGLPLWLVIPPLIGILGWWLLFLVIVPSSASHEE
jgi:hypothetical protein